MIKVNLINNIKLLEQEQLAEQHREEQFNGCNDQQD